MGNLLHTEITGKILEAFFNVYHEMGYGFLEKVYENAMLVELDELGLVCRSQQPISVFYKGKNVGEYFADILVENKVIVELKAVEAIRDEHEAQLINYLRATNIEVGLLINFGKKPEYKRKVFSNNRK
ncbi:MAG: GxxExxY protein [Flavobacteriales bacterium]|nr:GxxExxY protein [Flavobacteriales bacterium]